MTVTWLVCSDGLVARVQTKANKTKACGSGQVLRCLQARKTTGQTDPDRRVNERRSVCKVSL